MAWLCLPSLKLVYIVALWFYSTPKWEGGASKSLTPCGVEFGLTGLQNFALWSFASWYVRISHLRSGASPYLYASASTQWFIDILFITHDSRMSNKLCGRKTTKQNDFTLWNHSWLLSFCLTPYISLLKSSWFCLKRARWGWRYSMGVWSYFSEFAVA